MQPWRFEWRHGRLRAYLVPERSKPLLDFEHRASYLALGAAAENIDLAARDLGLAAEFRASPDPSQPLAVYDVIFRRAESVEPEALLFDQVRHRVTNRKRGPRRPLESGDAQALQAAAAARGASLLLRSQSQELAAIGVVLGRGDRIRYLAEGLHRELMSELRWTAAEAARTRDGIDLTTLELSAADRAVLPLLADGRLMAELRLLGIGAALEQPAREALAGSSAVGLLTAPGAGAASYVAGGRALQRVWLTASARGLAFQPWSILPYLFARLEAGGAGLGDEERRALSALRGEYRRVLPAPPDHAELMVFRLSRAGSPTARALRRPVEQVLSE
jgi:hypothetical protein